MASKVLITSLPTDGMKIAQRRIARALRQHAKRLDLSNLGLTSVPMSVNKLRKVQILELNRNRLTKLPRGIGKLTELRQLRVESNALRTVPKEIPIVTGFKVSFWVITTSEDYRPLS